MSDPDFSADLEGISPSPSDDNSSDEDVDPLEKLEFDEPEDYTPDESYRIFVRGYAESYDEWFLIVLDAEPDSDEPELQNLDGFSAQDPERFTGLEFDASPEFDQRLLNLRDSLNQTERKDSKNFENKLNGLLAQTSTLDNLLSPLAEKRMDAFREGFTDFLIDEVFPGSQLNLHARVVTPEQEEPSESDSPEIDREGDEDETGEEDEDETDDSLKLFKVSPELDPIDGFALSDLREGDAFDVRVVGESVRDLREQYVDGDPEEADRSKIFNATLVRVQDVSLDGVKKYIVQLTENIYGECTLDPETRVKVRQIGDVSFMARIKHRVFYALLFLFILVFSLSITFFLIPEPILNLIDAVTSTR